MSTLSTRDQIREHLKRTISDLERFAADIATLAPASRISPQHRLADLREALRLLDSLTPAVPRNPVEVLRVALDYGAEREWPLDVREMVARLLPEMRIATCWTKLGEGVAETRSRSRYHAGTGEEVGRVVLDFSGWQASLPSLCAPAASLEGAQADVDAQLSGWVLGGGPVTVDPNEEYDDGPVSGTGARVVVPLESEWAPQITPPEEEQPAASWLRHIRPAEGDVRMGWVYEGPTAIQMAGSPGGALPLLNWLAERDLLIGELEPIQRNGEPWVRIVTRAPLDGDWCANCGENMDGRAFLASRTRIVRGEEATVCGSCAEDSDGGWP